MSKYIIAETWNGEGYSYSNTAEILDFQSDDDAQCYLLKRLEELDLTDDWTIETERGSIYYSDDCDTGSFQWYKIDDADVYGVVIRCNINEVNIVDKKEYDANFKFAWKQRDPDDEFEYESIDGVGDGVFIGAHHQDYDYQFIRFK